MFLKQLELGPMANYVYLVGDPAAKECAVVDPGWDAPAILKAVAAEGCRVKAVLLTHHHFDHANGLEGLLKDAEVPVYIHRDDAGPIRPVAADLREVEDASKMRIGSVEVEFLHTPGHTAGSQCLRVEGNLLTGDTLFIGGCGRVDLPDSDPAKMYKSLRRIAGLPGTLVVWPGHGYGDRASSPLSCEVKDNHYLKSAREGREAFLGLV
ncbi:MAG: MBL fold metallo-hydrolase [Elusimicrobia bacterium]|nr:MBL fold metallo-hydrolase [Elusimicrobiota bacterium]